MLTVEEWFAPDIANGGGGARLRRPSACRVGSAFARLDCCTGCGGKLVAVEADTVSNVADEGGSKTS
mgnify:FL=1